MHSTERRLPPTRCAAVVQWCFWPGFVAAVACTAVAGTPAASPAVADSTWPQGYAVQRVDAAGELRLSTAYYTVVHDLKRGGAIASVRLTHGRSTNLLMEPLGLRVRDAAGTVFTDLADTAPRVSHRTDGLRELVTVDAVLKDGAGQASGVAVRTVYEYRWGYVKIRRELVFPEGGFLAREVCPVSTVLAPGLTHYGYREGTTEQEGAPAFAFGSNKWGRLRDGHPEDGVDIRLVPRSVLVADPGQEGLEWFAGSDLRPWEIPFTGRRGNGRYLLQPLAGGNGHAFAVSPLFSTNEPVRIAGRVVFDFHLGLPLLEGRAQRPWLHTSFNRNRGDWVSPEQVRGWATNGIQTVHCHNDGDYYDDGLFWRDGSYPPYPDMDRFDAVIAESHRNGLRVATYFSNKELHPSTAEFQRHGREWGRMNARGALQHNLYRGTNEFGVQMCLRSGWKDFLKFSIDRVLKHHALDGVYYDWNVALYCANGAHEGGPEGAGVAGHWDIEELLELMEWTRARVGPGGLVIVHNTTTPMFALENFASHVVANEWGYGAWKTDGPALDELPLEWTLVGARPRGVISYGQLNAESPRRLHRVFALEALLGGVTPWPASPETFELFPVLKPLGDPEVFRFADWRNRAVRIDGPGAGAAVYSRPGESYVVLANLRGEAREVVCRVDPQALPHPLVALRAATLLATAAGGPGTPAGPDVELDVRALTADGVRVPLPADGAVLLRLR